MSVDFPNEPAGFLVLTNNPWNTLCGSGWAAGSGGSCTQDTNNSWINPSPPVAAPFSSPNVLDLVWHHNTSGGNDLTFSLGGSRNELFLGFYHMMSNPYYGWSNNQAKLFLIVNTATGNHVYFKIHTNSQAATSGHFMFNEEGPAPFNWFWEGGPDLAFGQWRKYEIYMKGSSPSGAANGQIKLWVDGSLIVNIGDATLYNTFEWLDVSPIWDGAEPNFPTAVDHQYWDHLYVSASGGDTTPPAAPTGVTVS